MGIKEFQQKRDDISSGSTVPKKQGDFFKRCGSVTSLHQRLNSRDNLTLRRLMSYIYMEHPFLMFLDHTQRRSTVGRTPLDE